MYVHCISSQEGLEEVTSSEGGKDDLFTSIIAPQQNQQEEVHVHVCDCPRKNQAQIGK